MSTITFELVLPTNKDRRIETEDGTVYYRAATSLYTIDDGRRLEVSLPSPDIELRGSIGSSLYFYGKGESKSSGLAGLVGKKRATHVFYKTSIADTQLELKLQQVNEIIASDENEVFPEQPYYAIKKGCKLTVYRFEEKENNSEGVTYDITGSAGAITGYRLIHRCKLILTQTSNDASLCHVSNTVKLLRMPLRVMGVYLRDDSDLIWLLLHSQKSVVVVNTKTLAVEKLNCVYEPAQPNSPSWDFAPAAIVSVRDGVFTYTLDPQKDIVKTEPRQLWRGRLPAHLQ